VQGLRLLLTPFPQQQFNEPIDRRSEKPSRGVACLDCHANDETNGASHLVGDIWQQEFRHRIETPARRGVNIQRSYPTVWVMQTRPAMYFWPQRDSICRSQISISRNAVAACRMADTQECNSSAPA
jgi:hypothetical protein